MKFIKSRRRLIILIILVITVLALASFAFYVSDYYHANNRALAALSPTNSYTVDNNDDFITFTPTSNKSNTGIIIYPGGKVEAESYAVIASQLAANGYTSVIVKMPFNLVLFDTNKADEVIANHTEIQSWVIVGHSLGGVFASDYALKQHKIKGVIYLAAYPSANASNASFKGLSIRGSRDNLTTSEDITKNRDKFPANTIYITIPGGNHYNVGDYGLQQGDNNSTISREEQQKLTITYILEFLRNL